jgi:steroid delta-isomerase-like uncharacterized protein
MAADSKGISRRVFEDIWNNKKLNAVDELMAASYVHHDPQSPVIISGIDGYKQFVEHYLSAFPDLHFTVEDEFGDEQTIVSRWTATGTHGGDLPGIPRTGRPISVTGMTIARVRNGKFIESWSNWDTLGLMQQLGAVPAQVESRAA